MIPIRLQKTAHRLSFGPGIFGWMAIQVHAKIVDKQLHNMLHIDLVPNILILRVKSDAGVSVGSSWAVGRAKAHEK